MAAYRIVKNALIIGGMIVLIYIIIVFISGRHIGYDAMQGTWVSVCGHSEYIFIGSEYTHNSGDSGSFRIRGNRIIFVGSGRAYTIRVTRTYIIINGTYYLRRN